MQKYHKNAWAEYKRKYGIQGSNYVRQKVLVKTIMSVLGSTDVYEEAKFDWLRGPQKCPLRVDAFFPAHNLIVEYDGEQHFFPVQWNNQSKEDALRRFQHQQVLDTLKNRLVLAQGINLLRFSYKEPIDDKTYVCGKLKEAGILF